MPSIADPRPGRVLVTDGEFKHTLGIVRSLAARGHEVHLMARSRRAPAVHSRAVHRWHPAPGSNEPAYDDRLLGIAAAIAPVSLVAVGSGTMAAADRVRDRLPAGVGLAIASRDALATANDKAKSAALARSLGVGAPEERLVATPGDAAAAYRDLGPAMVLKSAREEGRKVLRYVRRADEVAAAWQAVRLGSGGAVLAQRYVDGEGYGLSALYWRGKRVRAFAHRRVREWPPSGGTSACAESLPEAPALERAAGALLDALGWHGVAMVEFKGDLARGSFALMEINAKFWGSLDVALAAGVDFPGDLVALMEGRELPPQPPVCRVRFAWPLGGDLWHGLYRPASLPRVLWDAVSPAVERNVRLTDLLPTLWELAQWARSAPGAWREHRELR